MSRAAADRNLVTHMTWVQSRLPGAHVEVSEELVLSDSGLACDTFNFVCRRAPAREHRARRSRGSWSTSGRGGGRSAGGSDPTTGRPTSTGH